MMTDALAMFVPIGGNLSLVAGAGINVPSTLVYDILGLGVGVAPTNDIIGAVTVFGSDTGLGGMKAQVEAVIGTAPTTSNSATLNVAFQGAIDNGSAQPGTWNTFVETGPIAVANLTAGTVIARFDWPPAFPANLQPRFLRLLFQVPAATNFTAGTISSAIVTLVRDDYGIKFQPKNYVVA